MRGPHRIPTDNVTKIISTGRQKCVNKVHRRDTGAQPGSVARCEIKKLSPYAFKYNTLLF